MDFPASEHSPERWLTEVIEENILYYPALPVIAEEEEVLWLQGYRGREPSPKVKHLLQRALELGRSLAHPQAVVGRFGIREGDGETLVLDRGVALHPHTHLWEEAQELALGLGTIGPYLEEKVDYLFEHGEPALASFLDSVGSAIVEAATTHLGTLLCLEAGGAGPRLSPGHSQWDLREQSLFFQLLPAHQIGMTLNESCLMLPRKSVSFAMSLGRGLQADSESCSYCALEGCLYRRRRQK